MTSVALYILITSIYSILAQKKHITFVTTSPGLPYCFTDFVMHTKQGVFFQPVASNTQFVVEGKYAIGSSQNLLFRSLDSLVGIATAYGLDGPSSSHGSAIFFSSPQRPDCGAHPASNPMCTGGLFPRGYSGRGVKLTIHFHLVPRSRNVEPYLHSPMSSWHSA
jgi:hypothetical protein